MYYQVFSLCSSINEILHSNSCKQQGVIGKVREAVNREVRDVNAFLITIGISKYLLRYTGQENKA